MRIDRLDDAADDLAELFLVEGQLGLAFSVADALLDHLAGGLSGHAAKVARGAFDHHHAAQFGLGVVAVRLGQRALGARILHRFDHFLLGENGHLACFQVDLGFHLLGVGSIDCAAVGRNHGRSQAP